MKQQLQSKLKKGDRTRQRILEAATGLMAEKGHDAVSMREIAAALKITKPVLYYYFKDKDELIKAAFLEGTKHIKELTFDIAESGQPLEAKLEMIFRNHLDFMARYPEMPKCAMKIMSSPEHGVLAEMARELKQRNRERMRGILARENLPRPAAENVVHMVSAVLTYFMVEARENGVASLGRDLPRRLARLIAAGARAAKALAAAGALWALAAPAAAAPVELTVDGAVQAALKGNTAVLNASETREIYREKITEYWGSVYPQLSANAQYTRNIESPSFFIAGNKVKIGQNNAYAASLDLNQVLWAGGKVDTGIRMAKLYAASSDEGVRSAQAGVRKAVRQLYYAVLLAGELAEIQEETLTLARQHLDTIEAQYRQGLASDLAVLRQKVEVSNSEPALTQARNLYDSGLLELRNLLGLEPEAEVALTGDFSCATLAPAAAEDLYAQALAARPEYAALKQQLQLYREMVRIERAGHYPYLSAFASRSFQGQTDSGYPTSSQQAWSTAAGLRLSLPIFSGGAVASRTEQAELQAVIVSNNLKELERKIKIEVKKAWLALREASARLASQGTAVEQARKALAATETRFKNGLANQLDLNDATLALNRAQTLFTQARHDVCSAGAGLDWAAGN